MTNPLPPMALSDGRFVVPGNRWDLLDANPFHPARVAVILPYYEQPDQLALVLRALELQSHPRDLIEVVVADDGSAVAPDVTGSQLPVTVVGQEDRGFRAAAARNLGVSATTAGVLCFLDADTIPEPDYLRCLTRLPSILPDTVSTGRRRHADLTGWKPDMLADWWSGRTSPTVLSEPGWLTDAYDASADLLHADHRSYRHVISAVMCCSRELFDAIGGFDESFGQYGGEDWEFAHRALVNGAVLHHCRRAVAWHDGPDWGDRVIEDRSAIKNREALAMARLIPDPLARRPGLRYSVPRVAIDIDTSAHHAGSLVTTMGCLLHEDVGIWLHGHAAADLLEELGIDDPRIRVGSIPEFIARRCQFHVTVVGRPALPARAFTLLLERCGQPGVGEVQVSNSDAGLIISASWAANRRRRWTSGAVRLLQAADASAIASTAVLDADSIGLTSIGADADLSW